MWKTLSTNKLWLWLVISWFGCGVIATTAGFTGLFYPILSIVLIFPVGILLVALLKSAVFVVTLAKKERVLVSLISLWWFLHSLQVFVPETGFDALWYHLPLAQQTVSAYRFVGDTNFYQSFNPQFSDSIFYLGFAVAGETGAKIIAYLFGVTLALTTYILSRQLLNRTLSLLTVLLVSSFQVVSWQSSSFYIDIAKAFWELSALIFILQPQQRVAAGLAVGASLASKLFSILLLPLMTLITWILNGKKQAVTVTVLALLVTVPYYSFAHQASGNAFYSAFHHVTAVGNSGRPDFTAHYLVERTLAIPTALYEMAITREYTTPLVVLLLPLLIIFRKKVLQDKKLLCVVLFAVYQLGIWWYLPPTSVRYALSGFIVASILVVYLLGQIRIIKKNPQILFYGLLIFGVLAVPIRLHVAARSWQYLSGSQSRVQYLEQFLDGNVDSVLKKWHGLD